MFKSNYKKGGTVGTPRHTGNTKVVCRKGTRQRARSWCFTFNNYIEKDMAQLALDFQQIGIKKYCFQEEIGENETPHLQGVVNFKNPTEFNTLKKINPKIHWEKCSNLRASIKYCSKTDTRSGKTIHHGIKSNELWHKPIVLSYKDMLKDMKRQMVEDSKAVAKEWKEEEIEQYGNKYDYLTI